MKRMTPTRAPRAPAFAGAFVVLSAFSMALLCTTASLAAGPSQGPTPYPSRAQDWPGQGVIRVFDWMKDNRAHFWRERERKQGSLVFVGDSLTGNWRKLQDYFPSVTVANRGIGGDVSRGVLFRFQEDVLDLNPKAIVLLIGTNDLTAKQSARDTLANIDAILALAAKHVPHAPVVLCTVPPSANPKAPVDEQERKILNAGLRAMAAQDDLVALADLYAATVTLEGEADPKWFKPDLLHLNEAGYEQWKASLKPALREHGVL
jgi:lysophospholipase L1-like esterase